MSSSRACGRPTPGSDAPGARQVSKLPGTLRSALLLVPLLLACTPLHAQALAALRPGRTIRVETAAEVHDGRMRSLDGDTLRMVSGRDSLRLPLASVLRVDARHRERRARVVLERTLLGLGVGLAAGWLAGTYLQEELGLVDIRPAVVLTGASSGVVLGAYAGATRRIPARWHRVYP